MVGRVSFLGREEMVRRASGGVRDTYALVKLLVRRHSTPVVRYGTVMEPQQQII